jgi:glycerophosphoryl diester phosphodiesterase
MRAFEAAVQLGYRYLETDVQVTADGVLLAFHDPGLPRTCGRPGVVGDLPWQEIESARVAGTEPIPRFDELLEAWPDVRINVDCKSDAAAEPLLAAIRRHQAFDRVCVASFNDRRLRGLRRAGGPRLCTSSAVRELAVLWASGLSVGGFAAQVPERRGRIQVVTPRFIAAAHRRRLPVHVWTVNDRTDMERLLDLGVDGLITDRPTVLREVLVERGAWA